VITKKNRDDPMDSSKPELQKLTPIKKSEKTKKEPQSDLLHKNFPEKVHSKKPPKERKTLERNHHTPTQDQKETKSPTESNHTKSGEIELGHRSGIFSKSNSKTNKITRAAKNNHMHKIGEENPMKRSLSPKTPPRTKKPTRKAPHGHLDLMPDDQGLSSTYTKPKKPFFTDDSTKSPPKAELTDGDPSSSSKVTTTTSMLSQSTSQFGNIAQPLVPPKDPGLKEKTENISPKKELKEKVAKLSPIKNEDLKDNTENLSPAITNTHSVQEKSENLSPKKKSEHKKI